jgi:hypothetical protein
MSFRSVFAVVIAASRPGDASIGTSGRTSGPGSKAPERFALRPTIAEP